MNKISTIGLVVMLIGFAVVSIIGGCNVGHDLGQMVNERNSKKESIIND